MVSYFSSSALETEFLTIEQTPVAKLKKLNWNDDGAKHTCEFVYFKSYHPFVDGETLKDELIKYDEMVVTKVVHALTFKYVQTSRQMMPPYLSFFFGAYYEIWKTKQRPGWLLMRDTDDEQGESHDSRSAAGFGEPPPPLKGLAGATPKGKKVKKPVKRKWDPGTRYGSSTSPPPPPAPPPPETPLVSVEQH